MRFAPVLQAMVEIMGSSSEKKFGEALNEALEKSGIRKDEMSPDMEAALLTRAFSIIAPGRIPGAPDS